MSLNLQLNILCQMIDISNIYLYFSLQAYGGSVSTTRVAAGEPSTGPCSVGRRENITTTLSMRRTAATCKNRKRFGSALKCVMNIIASYAGSRQHGVNVNSIQTSRNVQRIREYSIGMLHVLGDGRGLSRMIRCVRSLPVNLPIGSSVI